MQLTIDTTKDSHADLKKVIQMLQAFIGESSETHTNYEEPKSNIWEDTPPQPDSSGGLMSMFNDSTEEKKEEKDSEDLFKDIHVIEY